MLRSRNSIKSFLAQAKTALDSGNYEGHAEIVSGNESADLDSLTSSLLYAYISSCVRKQEKPSALYVPIVNIPSSDLQLRPEFTALLSHASLQPDDLITIDDLSKANLPQDSKAILVDHNAPTGLLKKKYGDRLGACIDHHVDEGAVVPGAQPRIITKSGSCTSLVVQYLQSTWDTISSAAMISGAAHGQSDEHVGEDAALSKHWDAQVAKLGMGSILIDTYNLQDESKVTDHDLAAVKYLEAKILGAPGGARWDRRAFFEEIDAAKKDLDRLTVNDCLRKDYKMWSESGSNLGFSALVRPLRWLIEKCDSTDDLLSHMQKFSEERQLAVFVFMTASTGDDGSFHRELLVWALNGREAAERTVAFSEDAKEELGLLDWDGDRTQIDLSREDSFRHVWRQTKTQHSRKTVAPLLRKAFSR